MTRYLFVSLFFVLGLNGAAQKKQQPVAQQKPFTISSAGWIPTKLSAVDLGKKIDRALQTLTKTTAEMMFMMENVEGQGTVYLDSAIQDRSYFRLQYSLPSSRAAICQLIADGKQRGMFENGKWAFREPLTTKRANPSGALLAEAWHNTFPKYALLPIAGPWKVWEPLLNAWKSGAGGYKLKIETRQMPTAGQIKPFYRITATRKSPVPNEIECVIDGTRFLPLTLRSNSTPKGKKPAKYQWTSAWKFGQKIDVKSFVVP